MAKKVVITGGAGFIGSHLSELLVDSGYHAIIIDDFSTGRLVNINNLLKRENVELVRGSITELSLLKEAFKGVSYVFHQAAIVSVPRSIEDPQSTNEVNIGGTLNVLMASKENNVKKVVFASSSAIYGDTPTLPKREEMVPNPKSPYALSKLAGEYYCHIFTSIYHLPTVCLRYFNIYGPRQDPNSEYAAVIPKFISSIWGNKPLTIYGDGSQTRDFTFVLDAVQANIMAAYSGAIGNFNIGTGVSISINELAHAVMSVIGKDLSPVYLEPRTGDVKDSLADIAKARGIGYEPSHSFQEGLKATVASFTCEK